MVKKLDLASPWQIHRQKLAALFEYDEQVSVGPVEQSENGPSVTVSVNSHVKADALRKCLASPGFGDVLLSVVVLDTAAEETPTDILKAAFAYNPLVRGVETQIDPTGTPWTYLVMEPDIVQFPADNLADYRRNQTMTAEQAARDVLSLNAGTAICTADLREN